MNCSSSAKATMLSIRREISVRVMPWIEAFSSTFSRPVKSGWKPAPSSSSETTRPLVSTVPRSAGRIPAITVSSVLLPAPLAPTTPSAVPGTTSRSTSFSATTSRERVRRRRRTVSLSVRLCSSSRR